MEQRKLKTVPAADMKMTVSHVNTQSATVTVMAFEANSGALDNSVVYGIDHWAKDDIVALVAELFDYRPDPAGLGMYGNVATLQGPGKDLVYVVLQSGLLAYRPGIGE